MPAASKQQQKLMGIVHALQKGDMKPSQASGKAKEMAKSMKKGDVKDFASTKHKGLPKKVKKEDYDPTKMYVVLRPVDNLDAAGLIKELNPLQGLAPLNVNMEDVIGVTADSTQAQEIAAEAYDKYCKEVQSLEEKKGKVGDKLKKTIDHLEKKRKEHVEMAKEDPKNASQHKEQIAKIATQIDDLMSKMERVEKSKKNTEKAEDKKKEKKSLEESVLGTIALGATLGMGVNWLKNKKKQIAIANQKDQEEKEQAKKDQERLQAVEKAKNILDNNKESLDKIKNNNKIKGWLDTINKKYNNDYSAWEAEGGSGYYSGAGLPPTWGEGSGDLIKNIEKEIISIVGEEKAKELLGALQTSGKGLEKGLNNESKKKDKLKEEFNPTDKVVLDIPLFIRLLEYAREDAKSDMDLHNVAQKAIELSQSGMSLSMKDYESLVGGQQELEELGPANNAANPIDTTPEFQRDLRQKSIDLPKIPGIDKAEVQNLSAILNAITNKLGKGSLAVHIKAALDLFNNRTKNLK